MKSKLKLFLALGQAKRPFMEVFDPLMETLNVSLKACTSSKGPNSVKAMAFALNDSSSLALPSNHRHTHRPNYFANLREVSSIRS